MFVDFKIVSSNVGEVPRGGEIDLQKAKKVVESCIEKAVCSII